MDQHALRRRWFPVDEAGLLTAFGDGLLDERNWCELKKLLGDGKAANLELARDLASLAVDGGSLLIGIDEDRPGGNPLHPVALRGLCERIEQVAATRTQPPLQIECSTVAAQNAGTGYVIVHVPASPLAPHQVEGAYYGRGDKTKRRLPDPEVERLFARRASWSVGVQDELQRLQAYRASTESETPQLYAAARPVGGWPEMCRALVGDQGWEQRLNTLRRRVTSDPATLEALGRLYMTSSVDGPLGGLAHQEKTSTGARLTARQPGSPAEATPEWWNVDLDIDESGLVWLFAGKIGEANQNFNGVGFTGVYLDVVASMVRGLLSWTVLLSEATGHATSWDIGVTVSNLFGARALPNARTPRTATLGLIGNPYDAREYTGTARASLAELMKNPGAVTQRLLGLLARGMHADAYLAPLLTAPIPPTE